MNDELAVRVRNRRHHIQEQAHTGFDSKTSALGERIDALALDVLQHQIRLTAR
jgi:hypothetical protein